jgi:molecular chaperone GrpE
VNARGNNLRLPQDQQGGFMKTRDIPEKDMADDERATGGSASSPVDDGSNAQGTETEVSALKRERDDLYDRLLRKTAEFDNYRKRIEREKRDRSDEAVTDLLRELLLVVDDFDLALNAEKSESVAAYRKGIELIHAKLHDLLRKQGVQPIVSLGTDFDPNLHQAVTYEESSDARDGEVVGELRRGYKIGDRLLRPAMVKVAKA